MISFWISIAVVCVFCLGVIFVSVNKKIKTDASQERALDNGKLALLFPMLFILAAPVVYYSWDTYSKQMEWLEVNAKVEQLKDVPDASKVEMSIQDLILGLRTQAFQNPGSGQLWFDISQAYAGVEMREAAIASLERAMRLNDNPDWKVVAAQLLTSGNDPQQTNQALFLLRQALQTNPDHHSGLLTLGFTYYRLSNYQQAIAAWQKLSSLEELSPKSRQFILQQIEQAQSKLEQAAKG